MTDRHAPVGQRLLLTQGTACPARSYGKADRLTAAGALAATSDADGNLTGLSGAGISETFVYDQANRLTSVTFNGATTTDAYDGDGLRTSQTTGGTATSDVWDMNGSLPQLLADGARSYVYGLGLAYSVDAANTVLASHTDGLGSVRALTDGSGNVVQTYQTDAFGVPTNPPGSQGTASQPFGYTGQQADATGLVYLRARYYAPALGRFLSRDPVLGTMGNPLSLNRYAYVMNNPTIQIDPSGHDVLGTYTHTYVIEPAFLLTHPSYSKEQTYVDSVTGAKIRIDLLDWHTNTFYEIKPWNEKTAGLQQIQQRASLGFVRGGPVPDMWVSGWLPGLVCHVWFGSPGLLLYEWNYKPPPFMPIVFPGYEKDPSVLPGNFPNPAPEPGYAALTLSGSIGANKSVALR